MAQKERDIINDRLKNLPEDTRLFRINSGMGWTGKIVKKYDNFIILENPRPFHAAPEGWPDLAGIKSIEITPDMVGKRIGVFYCEEIKTGNLKLSKIQK